MSEATRDFRDWSKLPHELLEDIASRLTDIPDHVRFHSVCPSWRSIPTPLTTTNPTLPWCLLFPNHMAYPDSSFFNPSNNHNKRLYTLRLPNHSPPTTVVYGSSFGYLLIINNHLSIVSLLNPFTGAHTLLPPLPIHHQEQEQEDETTHIWHGKLVKWNNSFSVIVALAPSPAPSAFLSWRPGATAWTRIDSDIISDDYMCTDFINYDEDKFLLLGLRGGTSGVTDPSDPSYAATGASSKYLVESSQGEILKIVYIRRRKVFEVYRLERGEQLRWVQVRSIGDDVVFVDVWNARCVHARGVEGCKGNSIYFWDHDDDQNRLGVFDVGHNKLEHLPQVLPQRVRYVVWVTPSV